MDKASSFVQRAQANIGEIAPIRLVPWNLDSMDIKSSQRSVRWYLDGLYEGSKYILDGTVLLTPCYFFFFLIYVCLHKFGTRNGCRSTENEAELFIQSVYVARVDKVVDISTNHRHIHRSYCRSGSVVDETIEKNERKKEAKRSPKLRQITK